LRNGASKDDPERRQQVMRACTPVTPDGLVSGGFGRASAMAVAEVSGGKISSWEVLPVAWDVLHDSTSEGGHHARVARFLMDQRVELVVAGHMGDGMRRMLDRMGLAVVDGVAGDARDAVTQAAAGPVAAQARRVADRPKIQYRTKATTKPTT
jgi:predicted Fe-Mo cluster-binding NifX family protein